MTDDTKSKEENLKRSMKAVLLHLQEAEWSLQRAGQFLPDDSLEVDHLLADWNASVLSTIQGIDEYLESDESPATTETWLDKYVKEQQLAQGALATLIEEAALAVEMCNEDDLERYAKELHDDGVFDDELLSTS